MLTVYCSLITFSVVAIFFIFSLLARNVVFSSLTTQNAQFEILILEMLNVKNESWRMGAVEIWKGL